MKTVSLRNLGRFGNQLFRYAYARALCEQNGYELRTEPWPGERIFTLDGHEPQRPDGTEDIVIDEYRQMQKDLIYTRADCRRWFKFRPEVEAALETLTSRHPHAHLRRGDYAGAGYPLVSRQSVEAAVSHFGIEGPVVWVSDESPTAHPDFVGDLSFVPDFHVMTKAPVLYRANSTFSWWAATLGNARVFSPIIRGFAGGVEHDNVPYVEGNWPACAELPCVTDLYLKEA